MQPRQYSMVWMAWCINTSAVSNTCNKHSFIVYTRTTIANLRPHEWSKRRLPFSYLFSFSLFLHLPMTGVDVPVLSHQWMSVFFLASQKTRNISKHIKSLAEVQFSANINSPHNVVCTWMSHIDIWASRIVGTGQNTVPAPPEPSAPRPTCEEWQQLLAD